MQRHIIAILQAQAQPKAFSDTVRWDAPIGLVGLVE